MIFSQLTTNHSKPIDKTKFETKEKIRFDAAPQTESKIYSKALWLISLIFVYYTGTGEFPSTSFVISPNNDIP